MRLHLIIIILIASIFILAGCASNRELQNNKTVRSTDSAQVVLETRYVERVITDTLYIELRRDNAHVVTHDTTSHLENDIALSDARIGSDGMLYHTLELKETKIPLVVPTKTIMIDSVSVVKHRSESNKTESVHTEKQLSIIQRLKLDMFWYLVVAVLVLVVLLL